MPAPVSPAPLSVVAASALSPLAAWLSRQPKAVLVVYAMFASFAAYTSMYAFRKPFTATDYGQVPNIVFLGTSFGYKSIAVIAQIMGYMISKFIGIKFASEAPFRRRVPMVLGLILAAELALFLFAVVPPPWNLICIFANGLPLGMIWSLIFGVLEGRRITELLALALSVSVIFASGWVKSAGRMLMDSGRLHVPEFWMPVATGAAFIPLLLLSLFMLYHVPPPDAEDIANRTVREPMDRTARRAFIRMYFPGVALLVFGYLVMMTFRDLRETFMVEFLKEQNYKIDGATFAMVENWVGSITIGMMLIGLPWIKAHRTAVWVSLGMVASGAVLVGAALVAFQAGLIGPIPLMVALGVGIYAGFVPYQTILFERLLAAMRTVATASFLMVLADAYSYLSTAGLYVTKDIGQKITRASVSWSQFIIYSGYFMAVSVPLCMAGAAMFFRSRMRN